MKFSTLFSSFNCSLDLQKSLSDEENMTCKKNNYRTRKYEKIWSKELAGNCSVYIHIHIRCVLLVVVIVIVLICALRVVSALSIEWLLEAIKTTSPPYSPKGSSMLFSTFHTFNRPLNVSRCVHSFMLERWENWNTFLPSCILLMLNKLCLSCWERKKKTTWYVNVA